MIVELVPEDIIWEFLATRLQHLGEPKFEYAPYFSRLPSTIDWSEEFLPRYRKNVSVAIQKAIVETFGLRPFLFLERDQVVRRGIHDPAFWRELSFVFSRHGADVIWAEILRAHQNVNPDMSGLTPADALFLGIVNASFFQRFSFEWLQAKKAHWLIVAMFLYLRIHSNATDLPWACYLQKPASVELPLRELLIEKTAEYFQAITEAIGSYAAEQDGPARVRESRSGAVVFQMDESQAATFFLSLRPDVNLVRAAVSSWTNDGCMGLDDGRFIEGIADRTRLYAKIDAANTALREWQAVVATMLERRGR